MVSISTNYLMASSAKSIAALELEGKGLTFATV